MAAAGLDLHFKYGLCPAPADRGSCTFQGGRLPGRRDPGKAIEVRPAFFMARPAFFMVRPVTSRSQLTADPGPDPVLIKIHILHPEDCPDPGNRPPVIDDLPVPGGIEPVRQLGRLVDGKAVDRRSRIDNDGKKGPVAGPAVSRCPGCAAARRGVLPVDPGPGSKSLDHSRGISGPVPAPGPEAVGAVPASCREPKNGRLPPAAPDPLLLFGGRQIWPEGPVVKKPAPVRIFLLQGKNRLRLSADAGLKAGGGTSGTCRSCSAIVCPAAAGGSSSPGRVSSGAGRRA